MHIWIIVNWFELIIVVLLWSCRDSVSRRCFASVAPSSRLFAFPAFGLALWACCRRCALGSLRSCRGRRWGGLGCQPRSRRRSCCCKIYRDEMMRRSLTDWHWLDEVEIRCLGWSWRLGYQFRCSRLRQHQLRSWPLPAINWDSLRGFAWPLQLLHRHSQFWTSIR